MSFLLVALGAAIGGPLRYLVDRAIQARHDSVFPWGTFTVNIAGSFILGVIAGLPTSSAVMALTGTGLCGALTTYSSFGYEVVRLVQVNARALALLNVAGSISAGLGAGYTGLVLAQAILG
ncbi:MAG TPA: CrcB family protein [Nocardioidaceae bacterium]|nr:CrcB family protein [Nocardioidaceae bacterium]